jgi:hypothetical protein
MAMRYPELLEIIRGYGFDQIGRFQKDGYDMVFIGKKEGNVIPLFFSHKDILLPNGNETEIEDEEIASVLRWIEKQSGKPRK